MYFGLDNQEFGLVVLIIETLIIISLTVAVIEARRLRVERHRRMIISIYFVQGLVVISWMGRRFLENYGVRYVNDPSRYWMVLLHATIGATVALLATGMIIAMIIEPDIHVAKMKRGKPLMRTVYILWVTNYSLGVFYYLNRYYLEWI